MPHPDPISHISSADVEDARGRRGLFERHACSFSRAMASPPVASTFTCFPRLPPELRLTIWEYTLPVLIDRALHVYRTGCWRFRELTASDPSYDPAALHHNELRFHHDALCQIEYAVPGAHVNSESRRTALP